MALRAVFLDLDDTLVATSEHDVRAFNHAASVADERAGPLDRERLVADVRAGIKRAPWDPEYKVEVTEWRAALWASALENQGLAARAGGALALGAELQREYDANRMNDFPFMLEVPDVVAHLRKRGLRVVVITNGHHVVQRDKLAACAAHVLFPEPETIIVGGEEVLAGRLEKPHESIFLRACDVAGCAPNQAVHVGDSLAADVQVSPAERFHRAHPPRLVVDPCAFSPSHADRPPSFSSSTRRAASTRSFARRCG